MMPTPQIIEVPEDQNVVCPICQTVIVDAEEGLVSQPSCPHIRFVYANGECFEYDPAGLEAGLNAAQEEADEEGDYLDEWEWLLGQCDERDVILEHNSEEMACGAISFKVWIGIRKKSDDDTDGNEFSSQDFRKYFHPTAVFVKWMQVQFSGKLIYDVGSGMGHVAKLLAKAGLHISAIDLEPRDQSEFPVVQGDSTMYRFEKGSVVMFCRPSHENRFVWDTICHAIECQVIDIVYVGLNRNFRDDVGGFYGQFVKRRVKDIGHSDERIWEMKVGRLRRGSIPPL